MAQFENRLNDRELEQKRMYHFTNTMFTLFWQFLMTFGLVTLVTFNATVFNFTLKYNRQMLLAGFVGSLAMIFVIAFSKPKTDLQLAMFTLFESMVVCSGTVYYGEEVVVLAMLATLGISGSLGCYALSTRTNHTYLMGALFSSLTCLLMMLITSIFLQIPLFNAVCLYFGTMLFFIYLVVDIQFYLRDDKKICDDVNGDLYIDAALNIYLDMINIFVRLLPIIADLTGNKKIKIEAKKK